MQLNKSPPTQPSPNRGKNYNYGATRGRPTFTLYDSDSSSSESTESDSDVTSSDSSEEENKKGRFRGLNRGKYMNNNLRNGANKNNGVRSTSAKITDTNNKRDLHTQRNLKSGKYSPAGSLTGRSVKSESSINATLAKRKVDNSKNVTSITDVKTNGKVENGTSQSKSNIPAVVEKQKVQQAEREKVLKKYGLGSQPSLNNQTKITKITSEANTTTNGAITPVEKNVPVENVVKAKPPVDRKDKPLKTVKSDSLISCSGYFVEDVKLNKPVKTNAFESEGNTLGFKGESKRQFDESVKVAEMDTYISSEIETFRKQRNVKHLERRDLDIRSREEGDDPIERNKHDLTALTSETLIKSQSFENGIKEVHSEQEITIIDNAWTNGSNSVRDEKNLLSARTKENPEVQQENPKVVEHNKWKKETTARDKVLQLLDKKGKEPIEINSCTSSVVSRNENRNDKGSKMLSEKVAKSFSKYAKLASSKKGSKKHSKKHRISQKDRPSPGAKTGKALLKSVNSRPYGYAHRQANVVKGVGPFHRINKRTLNSAIEHPLSVMTPRSGSADLPKISYRHQIQPTPTFDTRTLTQRNSILVSPDLGNNIPEEQR